MIFTKVHKLSEIVDNYDLIMFDLWGVLIEGATLYPKVGEMINKLMQHKQVCFVTNAPRVTEHTLERLTNFGIICKKEQIFTSGQMSRDLMDGEGHIIYHLGHENYPNTIEDGAKITRNIEEATALLLTIHLDEGEDLEMYNSVLEKALKLGLLCICANPDKIIPNHGKLRYCPGYFAEVYEKMGGRVAVIGKPGKDIFIKAMNSLSNNPSPDRVLMIGDTLDTDIIGAQNVGIHSALVLTGNSTRVLDYCRTDDERLRVISDHCVAQGIMPTMLLDIIA